MSKKGRLTEKARKLGREHMSIYRGCAQTTLLAIADTLNMDISEDLYKAMIGLSSLSGGCGGICGATAAISLRYGVPRGDFESDSEASRLVYTKILNTVKIVRDKMSEKYGGFLCCDIQRELFGRPYDLTVPEERDAFSEEPVYEKCPHVTEDAAGWTVEAILDTE